MSTIQQQNYLNFILNGTAGLVKFCTTNKKQTVRTVETSLNI